MSRKEDASHVSESCLLDHRCQFYWPFAPVPGGHATPWNKGMLCYNMVSSHQYALQVSQSASSWLKVARLGDGGEVKR